MSIADLPRPVGYVLGGGGSLGAVQVGMLQALSEHDIAPGVVAGTSVGSLNGAVVAMDPFPGHTPAPRETMAEVLFYTAMVTMRAQAVFEAPLVAAEVPVIYLHGAEPHTVSPLDFRQTGMLIESAYEAARSFLTDLDVTGPGLYGSP
jgi:predicted acylesterase/phospholipase RssA